MIFVAELVTPTGDEVKFEFMAASAHDAFEQLEEMIMEGEFDLPPKYDQSISLAA
jgi:phosphotransferase system HPr-like phosphotransfer protein